MVYVTLLVSAYINAGMTYVYRVQYGGVSSVVSNVQTQVH